MSTQTIPEKKIITCDCCRQQIEGAVTRREGGGLHLKRDALDWHGHACADASVKLDLCDSCLGKVVKAVNETCASVRALIASASGVTKS